MYTDFSRMVENASKLTIVTSMINYYHTPLHRNTLAIRFARMKPLLESGISIVVYVSPDLIGPFDTFIRTEMVDSSHIRMVPLQKPIYESSYAYLIAKQMKLELPNTRHIPKDTYEFICFTHSKIGFIHHVSTLNPFNTPHFAWIDCDITCMWKNTQKQIRFLQHIAKHGLTKQTQLPATETAAGRVLDPADEIYVPVCAEKSERRLDTAQDICDRVCWRYCTNFFVGTHASIQNLYRLYTESYEPFLEEYKTVVWDMNFWVYLEQEKNWNPITYMANHDDRIVQNFPLFALAEKMKGQTYLYPMIPLTKTTPIDPGDTEPYYPSSGSMITRPHPMTNKTEHLLNMRYVNYFYLPSGHCTHGRPIQSLNKLYNLTYNNGHCDEVNPIWPLVSNTPPRSVNEDAETMGLPMPNSGELFQGIEDIRLFMYKGELKFFATSVNYSGCGIARIVCGDYVIEYGENEQIREVSLKHVGVIQSPGRNDPGRIQKEKNWIPFVPENNPNQLYVIYRWANPMFEMGSLELDKVNNIYSYKTRYTYPITFPYQEEIRGSSNIVYDDVMKMYVALVHLSVEDTLPKQYYHMLVWLDPSTYAPRKYSKLMYFWKLGVEFCLSWNYEKTDRRFTCWFSCMDRDPRMISVDRTFFTGENEESVFELE